MRPRHPGRWSALVAILAVVATATCSRKTSAPPPSAANQLDRVLGPIDPAERVEVPGSVHPLTRLGTDLGELPPDFALNGIILGFRQSPAQAAELAKLLEDQQNPASPRFHKWLTDGEFGRRFGLTEHDLDAITKWLTSQGLTVLRISSSRTRVFIAAQAQDVDRVFHTRLRRFLVNGEEHFANARPVEVPRALGDLVLFVAGLDDFLPKAHPRAREEVLPDFNTSGGAHAMAPSDFATIYDIQNLYNNSTALDGTGASLAVVGQTMVTPGDLTSFRTVAGLPTQKLNNWLVTGSGSGTYMGATADIEESTLDLEWSGAVARNATINFVYTGGGSGFSVWNSIEAIVGSPSSYGNPTVVSISYGACEPLASAATANGLETYFQEGNTKGLTFVVSTGDSGAAGCDVQQQGAYADGGLAVQLPASFPEVTALGGTELNEGSGTYWSTTNGTNWISALSYIPEIGWNDSALGGGLAASNGGASIFFSKPSWQTGTGVPADGKRDVPDLALSASWDHDAYDLCITNGGTQYCAPGDGWTSTTGNVWLEGGTSAAAPTFAGMITVLNQAFGSTGLGNINSTLYSLVVSQPSVFHDTTTGNNIVPCNPGSASCGCPTGVPGCTGTQNQFGYTAGTGYDQVTGLGSVDAYNLWLYWPTATTTSLTPNSTTAVVGETVTLSSAVTTNRIGPAITGNIAFEDGAIDLSDPTVASATSGSGVVSGSGSYVSSGFTAGTHTLSAMYSGDSTYVTSTSGSTVLTITSGITVSPSGGMVAEGGIIDFSATGGIGPYSSWSVTNTNGSSIVAGTGVYTAGTTPGTDTVHVLDSQNYSGSTTVTIVTPIAIAPTATSGEVGIGAAFSASNGQPASYQWFIKTNNSHGSLGSTCTTGSASCTYTPGTTSGVTDTVSVTDALSETASATITVAATLGVSPASASMGAGSTYSTYSATGGVSPYTWGVSPTGHGVTISSTGAVTATAGATSGSYTILLADALNVHATAFLTLNAALAATPATSSADIGGAVTLHASGGSGSGYTWTIGTNFSTGSLGSNCTVGSNTCTWTTGSTSGGADVIDLKDGNGVQVTASITVDPKPIVSPASTTTDTGIATLLTASSGSGSGYAWSINTNGSSGSLGSNCTVGSTTCTWTTGATASATDKVLVTDSNGGTATATITTNPLLIIAPATKTTDANTAISLTASGGSSSGYTWAIGTSGSGGALGSNCTPGSTTCTWTTGPSAGTDTIKLSDSTGKQVTSTITVDGALVVSPSSKTTDTHQAILLTASGGSGSGYTWVVTTNSSTGSSGSNCATSGSATCTWTTGANSGGTDVLKVTDSNGVAVTASITVDPTLVVSPATKTTDATASVTLTASGGSGAGFTWTITTNHSVGTLGSNCTVGSATCTWNTGATSGGSDVITLTDSNSVSVSSTITVNPALVVTPASTGTDVSHPVTLTASGGSSAGYTWTIGSSSSGGSLGSNCTVGSATCTWNAGTMSGGLDLINLTDSNSVTVTSTIAVGSQLVVTPATSTVDTTQSVALTATGGSGSGYKWTISTNGSGGSLSGCTTGSTTCTWVVGATGTTTDKIQLADSNNITTLATVTVNALLTVTPAAKTTDENAAVTLTATGGSGTGYTWAVGTSGSGGSRGANCIAGGTTCTWTAGGSTGTDTVILSDSLSRSVTATITVDTALVLTPATKTIDAKQATTLTASGGSGSGYTWAIGTNSSSGSLGANCTTNSTTCTWTAGVSSGGTDIVKVTDSNSVSASSSLTIGAALVVTPATKVTDAGASVTLTASAGSGSGYAWTIGTNHSSGFLGSNCTAGSTTCTWTTGVTSGGSDLINLTDSNAGSVTATITVDAALTVTPGSTGTDVNHAVTLTASGGSASGYTWTIGAAPSGGALGSNCTVGSATCTWTAGPTSGGTDFVDLTDSNGVQVAANISVSPLVVVSPVSSTVDTVQPVVLTASSGSGSGYKWTISTNGSSGSLGSNCTTGSTTCTWTTGVTGNTTDKIQLADSNNVTTLATVTVNALLTVTPAAKTTDENASVTLTASGGSGTGYTWAVGTSGSGGSLGANCLAGGTTCTWTAGGATGMDTVILSDSLSKTVTATITVNTALILTPATKTIDAKEAITLTASGGSGSGYTWAFGTNSSGGSLGANCTTNSPTCTWTAGATSGGVDTIKVTDSNGVSTTSSLTINPALVVSPATKTTDTSFAVTLTASAGSGAGYTWTIGSNHSGGGLGSNCTAGSATCTWTTGTTSGGNDLINVTDSNGATVTATITVNPALAVTPATTGIDVRNSVTLTASGGSGAGYTWTIGANSSGGSLGSNCTVGSTACTWTAGNTSGGMDVVDLTDSNNVTVTSSITIGSQIVLTPSATTLDTTQSVTMNVTGGSFTLYHWTAPTNGSSGSLGSNCTTSSTTCTWTVGATGSTTDVVKVTDSYGGSTTTTITVNPVLTVTPATKTTDEGASVTLTGAGGSSAGYTWAIGSNGSGGSRGGNCTVGSSSCTWTAGPSTGTDTITLTDSLGKAVTATITVDTALFVTPSSKVTDAKAATTLTVSGGSGTGYTWTSFTNSSSGSLGANCTVSSTTCTWTAGATSGGMDVIKVTDSNGVTVASSLTINPALVISPLAKTTDAGTAVPLTASGGSSSGYTWTIGSNHSGGSLGGTCTVGSTSCTWTAGATSGGNDLIDLTDSNGVTVVATITVNAALVVTPATTATDAVAAVALAASGGAGSGYTWAIGTNSSSGSLGANCIAGGAACTWTTGSISGGTDIVKLTDGNGVTVSATITVAPLLVVTPAATSVDTAQSVTLTASGGSSSGYKWTIFANGSSGSLGVNCTTGSTTCTWTTGATPSTNDKIQLTDSNNVSVLSTITVNPLLAVSPVTKTTDAGNTVLLTASGGSGSGYTWTVSSSGSGGTLGSNCTVGSASCTWNTGGAAGTDVIKLIDSTGKSVNSTITVDAQLVVAPATKTTDAKASVLLTVSGGSGVGYTWTVGTSSSGGGLGSNCTVGSTSCTWNVGATAGGTDTIKVTDGNGITVVATLTVNAALVVSPLTSTTEPGYTVALTASGGSGSGYAWSIGANGSNGSLGSNCGNPGSTSCTWTAGTMTTATDTIQLTDGNGVTVVATITVDPALAIAPVHPTATPGQILAFTASGGTGTGYTYSFVTGDNLSGGTMSGAGSYQAGATSGVTDTVQVKDSLGFGSTTTITVEGAIVISPLAPAASPGLQITFLATGGSGSGYAWSYPTGGNKSGGSLTSGGLYTGGATTGVTDTLLVTDGKGGTGTTTVTLYTAVIVSPANPTTTSGGAITFTATGGSGTGYAFSFATGGNLSGGTISGAGAYVAGNTNGVLDKIQVKDSVGLIGTTTITVDPKLVITPTAPTTVSAGTLGFSATGGSGSGYAWSYPTGGNKSGGTLSATGAYVAGSTSGVTDTVQVKDSAGNILTTTVVVDPKIVIVPTSPVVLSGGQQQFSASGGSGGGYTWAYQAGGDNSNGQITPAGLYTGGTTSGVTDTVKVTDGAGNTNTTTVIVHPAIVITPSAPTELVTQHVQFSAVGGSGTGYTWAFATGGNKSNGTLSAAGAYVAGSTSGVTDTVQVTDSSLSTATTTVIVDPTLTVSPTSKTVATGDTVLLTTTGGGGGNTWVISTNGSGASFTGSCSGSTTCTYKAGPTANKTDTITVTDAFNNAVTAVFTVNAAPALSPTSATVAVTNTEVFTATGGVGALTWSILPNGSGASFTSNCTGLTTCTYKAGIVGSSLDTVIITDTLGNTATAVVTVNPALGISPSVATVAVTDLLQLTEVGGVGPFNWTLVTNGSGASFTTGTCTAVTSCLYQAGSTPGTDTVKIADALSNSATIVITVNQGLGLSPPATTVASGDTIQFFASGGVSPLTWSITPNGSGGAFQGSCNGTYACVYVAGPTGNKTDTVLITDARNNTFSTVVTVNPALVVSPSSKTVAVHDTVVLTATGGVGTLSWVISTNGSGASFQASCAGLTTCTYVAGATGNQADTITVSDAQHHMAMAVMTVDPGLTLSPTAMTITAGDTVPFTASGGAGTLTWSVSTNHSGAAGLSACTGRTSCSYVAGPTGGTADVVTVTDALNNTASATVTVNAKLTVSPTVDSTEVSSAVILMASGGVAPLSWLISTNQSGAYFQASCAGLTTCTYVAGPTGSTVDTVTVTDALNHVATSTITVASGITLTPASITLVAGDSHTFTVVGGASPFGWSVTNPSGGAFSGTCATTCMYVVGTNSGVTDTVSVTDSLGHGATAQITVDAVLKLSPATDTVAVGDDVPLTSTGGVGPISWTISSNYSSSYFSTACGSNSSCVYVAGPTGNTVDTATVTDSLGHTATAVITVNPALTISPTAFTLAVGNSTSFAATGGVGTYTWSITTNHSGATLPSPCTGDSACTYKAGLTSGATDILTLGDGGGHSATATITVNAALAITPSAKTVDTGDTVGFTATGGAALASWTIAHNSSGSTFPAPCNQAATCTWKAGTTSGGIDTITVTDVRGNAASALITVNATVGLSPTALTVSSGDVTLYTATGGVSPLAWTIPTNGSGATFPSNCGSNVTCSVMAGPTSGTVDTVTVTDAAGHTASATVTVHAKLTISPTLSSLVSGNTQPFTASGGVGTLSWAISPNASGATFTGSCAGSTSCTYQAGSGSGTDTVTVSDTGGHSASATVVVGAPLSVSPTSSTVATGDVLLLSATGGAGTLTWTISTSLSGATLAPSCNGSTTCSYTAGMTSGTTDVVTVSDALHNTATASITVNPALSLSPVSTTVAAGDTWLFTASGGVGTLSWTITPNGSGATFSAPCAGASQCRYAAGSLGGTTDTLVVSDALHNTASAVITVHPALTVAPASTTVTVQDSVTLTASGGVGALAWSSQNNSSGYFLSSCAGLSACTWVTGPISGVVDTVTVTDTLGNTTTAHLTVNAALTISPATKAVTISDTITFTAAGGSSAPTWAIQPNSSGGGFLGSCNGKLSCTYLAGTKANTVDAVVLTDSASNQATATVTVSPSLAVSPTSATVATGDTQALTATGGVGSPSWAITPNNSGATLTCTDATHCNYVAGATANRMDTVVVTDVYGNQASSIISVNALPMLSPGSGTVVIGDTVQLTASGGVGAFTWSLSAPSGGAFTASCPVGSTTCTYQAGTTSGKTDTVTVTDSLNNHVTATFVVNPTLSLAPASSTVAVSDTVTLTAAGGTGGLTWLISSDNSGATFPAPCAGNQTCQYKAGTSGNTLDTVTVTDSSGHTASALVTVKLALAISPVAKIVAVGNRITFSSSGGVGALTWAISPNNSGATFTTSCTGSSCTYQAGTTANKVDTITVTDALSNTASATVTVNAALTETPAASTVVSGNTVLLTAAGGVSTLTWTISPNHSGATFAGGSCNGRTTCTYQAGSVSGGTDTITVSDSLGNAAHATVSVDPPLVLTPTTATTYQSGALAFSTTGGVPPLSWTVPSNNSGASLALACSGSANCTYTAGVSGGMTDTVTVTDAHGNAQSATVTVVVKLAVTPTTVTVAPNQPIILNVNGTGAAPYSWTLDPAATGFLSSDNGSSVTYTAGGTPHAQDTVTVIDLLGETATVTITTGNDVSISPLTPTIVAGTTQPFSAFGGDSANGYTWSVISGNPLGYFSGSVYTGTNPGTDTIQASDDLGNTATTTITNVAPLAVTPVSPISVAPRQRVTLDTDGTGLGPYQWSLETGPSGSLGASTGSSVVYTAGAAPNKSDVVTVTDALDETVTVTISVGSALTIAPLGTTILSGATQTFTANGGDSVDGYTWTVLNPSPVGHFNGSLYTAGSTGGTDTVQVSDIDGNTASTTITVDARLAITPASPVQLAPRQQVTLNSQGTGALPLTWSLETSPSGSLSATTGSSVQYTAATTPNVQDTVTVRDTLTEVVTILINVGPSVSVSPLAPLVFTKATQNFSASGGNAAGGYTWSITSASPVGSISATGVYTAGTAAGTDTILVSDSLGNSASTTVTVVVPLTVAPISPVSLAPRQQVTFQTASTGLAPWSWTLRSPAHGTLSSGAGAAVTYTAGTLGNQQDVLTIADSDNESIPITINIGPGLSLLPQTPTILVQGTQTFTAAGGLTSGGYTWTITNANPVGSLSGSVYTAGSTPGTDTVQVTDTLGNTATTTIAVRARLAVTPASPVSVAPRQAVSFSTGVTGIGPFRWFFGTSPQGSLSATSGTTVIYTAGSTPNTADSLVITDAANETVTIAVTIGPGITITPASPSIPTAGTQQFLAAGGGGSGYTWSLTNASPVGSLSGGLYTAGTTPGTDTVQVQDLLGNVATTTITVVSRLVVTPASPVQVAPGALVVFTTGSTGRAPYHWALGSSPAGSLSGSSGTSVNYTAGATANTSDVVTVTDALSQSVAITVNIGLPITISPMASAIVVTKTQTFTATGGDSAGGYHWSITNANPVGFMTGNVYSAGFGIGTDTIQARDSYGSVGLTTISVVQKLAVTPASPIALAPRAEITLQTGGTGVGPFTWTLETSPSGSLSAGTGTSVTYTAGAVPNSQDTITVTDSAHETVAIVVNVGVALTISPTAPTIAAGGTETFTASGGDSVHGYVWSITNANPVGTISLGVYAAGTSAGTDTVQVADDVGNLAMTTITVVPALALTPVSPVSVAPRQSISLSTSGTGVAPYSWSLQASPDGTLSADAGTSVTYTAGSTPNSSDVVTAGDALAESATLTINVGPGITIQTPPATIVAGGTQTYTATGGFSQGGYNWSVISATPLGSFSGATYSAGGPGIDTIGVSDNLGNTAMTTITVVAPLTASPASPVMLAPLEAVTFTPAGGLGPFRWTLVSDTSGGALVGTTFTAGPTGNAQATLTVSDALAEVVTINVTIGPGLSIMPATPAVLTGARVTFSALGGIGQPYQWSIPAAANGSGGSIGAATGDYTAGVVGGVVDMMQVMDTIQVKDLLGNVATTRVTVEAQLDVSPASTTALSGTLIQFGVTGGSGVGYSWSFMSDSAVTGSTITPGGNYQAGPNPGTDTVLVVDSQNNSATATVTIDPPLQVRPLSPVTVPPRGSVTFASSGGEAPVQWMLTENGSAATLTANVYTAGSKPDTQDKVSATDALQEAVTITINVGDAVSITPATATAIIGTMLPAFVAAGGTGGPYSWAIVTNANHSGGMIDPQTGVYTAGMIANATDIIEAVDSLGNTATATIMVIPVPVADAGMPGVDAGPDAGPASDGGLDAGPEDAGADAGFDAGESDAGTGVDAGMDAGGADAGDAGVLSDGGVSDGGPDAGDSDGGEASDAGDAGEALDAGMQIVDAGPVTPFDAGNPEPVSDAGVGPHPKSGCACGPGEPGGDSLAQLALFGLAFLMRRRRRNLPRRL